MRPTDEEKTLKFKQDIQIKAAINQFNEQVEVIRQCHEMVAIDQKLKYDAYIKAGFTPKQALEFLL